jgi:hypothetical protein
MTTNLDFISCAFGITTFSPLRVRSAVKRHWICDHLPGLVVHAHPVADLQRVVDLQRQPAEQVAQRVLHREGQHRGDHRRGGDQARQLDTGQRQRDQPHSR